MTMFGCSQYNSLQSKWITQRMRSINEDQISKIVFTFIDFSFNFFSFKIIQALVSTVNKMTGHVFIKPSHLNFMKNEI